MFNILTSDIHKKTISSIQNYLILLILTYWTRQDEHRSTNRPVAGKEIGLEINVEFSKCTAVSHHQNAPEIVT